MKDNIRVKPITTAARIPEEVQLRDTFETPRYATDILIPFLKLNFVTNIWECAVGNGRISRVLKNAGFSVYGTDIRNNPEYVDEIYNFITDTHPTNIPKIDCIITNPPFSIKDLFIEKAFEYGIPFAFLINADYSGKTIDWIRRGCQKIVPTSRIAFITPNILRRIHEGEVWKAYSDDMGSALGFSSVKDVQGNRLEYWLEIENHYHHLHNYSTIDEVPQELLYKYSSAQFHSMWLTYGLNLGATEVFVDLPADVRKNNIL